MQNAGVAVEGSRDACVLRMFCCAPNLRKETAQTESKWAAKNIAKRRTRGKGLPRPLRFAPVLLRPKFAKGNCSNCLGRKQFPIKSLRPINYERGTLTDPRFAMFLADCVLGLCKGISFWDRLFVEWFPDGKGLFVK